MTPWARWGRSFRNKVEPQDPPPLVDCAHRDWRVLPTDDIGYGHCLDCMKQVSLPELFNRLRERMEEALKEREKDA